MRTSVSNRNFAQATSATGEKFKNNARGSDLALCKDMIGHLADTFLSNIG